MSKAAKWRKFTFPGNERLRNRDVNIPLTQHQLSEYIKCKLSFEYFCAHYVHIVSLDHGIIKFVMRQYQKELYQLLETERFVIGKIPRQYGKTILLVAYLLWKVIFNDHQRAGIFANKNSTAIKILEKLQLAYEELPLWMQKGVVEWGKGKIKLDNGSYIDCGATTGDSGRSGSYHYILLDEFAFVPRNLQNDFYRAVYPVITAGQNTKIFIISTPNGMELFHSMWTRAEQGKNQYKPFEVHWSALEGRDAKWREEAIANMGQESFDQEYGCEFLGSGGNTLISKAKLKSMAMGFLDPILIQEDFKIFEEPNPEHVYCLCADTSQGVGADYAAFSVIDITTLPYKQVAQYKSNVITQTQYPVHIYRAAKQYYSAYVLVEINDGRQVADLLWNELECENQIFAHRRRSSAGQKIGLDPVPGSNPGIMMTHTVRETGIAHLKNLIESDQLIIRDHDTISELSTFIKLAGKKYQAESGKHDDLVMSLVVFCWMAMQPFFREISDSSLRDKIREQRAAAADGGDTMILRTDGREEVDGFEVFDGCVWSITGDKDPFSLL